MLRAAEKVRLFWLQTGVQKSRTASRAVETLDLVAGRFKIVRTRKDGEALQKRLARNLWPIGVQ